MKRPPKPPSRRPGAGSSTGDSRATGHSREGGNPARPAPAQRAPTYDDLLAIARLIESGSRFSEFRLRSGDIEVEVKRANGSVVAPAQAVAQAPAPAEIGPRTAAAPAASAVTTPAAADIPTDRHLVKSPMVGTFYRAPSPDKPPFVEIGARVEPDTVVCIIEVMKLMNSVAAGVRGVVTHILAQNAQPVEAGQPVIGIKAE